jgi:hypothetical protein
MPTPFRAALPLALLLATAAPAASADEHASFDFSIAGIRVGTLVLEFDQSGKSYTAASRIDTAGVVGLFTDFFFDGQARGRLSDGKVVPERYDATSKSPRALRETRIDWAGGTPVKVSVEPPRSSAPDPAEQKGTLDPVSAGFKLLRPAPIDAVCNTTVEVFDGSRRSRLKVAAPVRSEGGIVCDGTFARLEGEAHSLTGSREFAFRIRFAVEGDLARLERIEAPTDYGQAVVARRG